MGATEVSSCICFACDSVYLPHFTTALASLADHSPKQDVFLFGDNLSGAEVEAIRKFARGLEINLTIAEPHTISFEGLAETFAYTRAAWIRVFIPHLLPRHYRRMLYLDCDLVVLGAIDALFELDLDGNVAAAAINKPQTTNARERRILQMPAEAPYFNTGVFLVDLEMWREKKLSSEILEYAIIHPEKLEFVDQSAINHACWTRIKEIPGRYNFGGAESIDADPLILHFYSRTKPWIYHDVPGFEFYRYYRSKTPYSFNPPRARRYKKPAFVKRRLYLNKLLQFLGFDRGDKISGLQNWHDRVAKMESNRARLKAILSERLKTSGPGRG